MLCALYWWAEEQVAYITNAPRHIQGSRLSLEQDNYLPGRLLLFICRRDRSVYRGMRLACKWQVLDTSVALAHTAFRVEIFISTAAAFARAEVFKCSPAVQQTHETRSLTSSSSLHSTSTPFFSSRNCVLTHFSSRASLHYARRDVCRGICQQNWIWLGVVYCFYLYIEWIHLREAELCMS